MRSLLLAFGGLVVFATFGFAQDTNKPPSGERVPLFAHVNFGFQSQAQNFRQAAAFSQYDETGSWEAAHELKGGATFDIGGGAGLNKISSALRNVAVGLTYTARSTGTRDVTVNAQVPHPIFTDSPRNASVTLSGFEHSERAVHIQALCHVPVTVDFEVVLFGGPSIFTVRNEFIGSVTASEVGGDFSSANVESTRVSQQERGGGFHLGVDSRYVLLRNVAFIRDLGVGAMVRYSGGSVTMALPGGSGMEQKIDAGGPEISAGLRLRF